MERRTLPGVRHVGLVIPRWGHPRSYWTGAGVAPDLSLDLPASPGVTSGAMTTSPRVPNVHAHAVSGLDHVALGDDDRDALNVQDADLSTADGTVEQGNVVGGDEELPDTTGLIATSETSDDTSGSAPQEPQDSPQEPSEGDDGTGAPAEPAEGAGDEQPVED